MRLSDLDAAADNSELLTLYEAALRTRERQTTDVPLAVPNGLGGWRRIIAIPVGDDTVSVLTRNITRERYFESTAQEERERCHRARGRRSRWLTDACPVVRRCDSRSSRP